MGALSRPALQHDARQPLGVELQPGDDAEVRLSACRRVVAPTSVKGRKSSLIDRAAGPSPIMMSICSPPAPDTGFLDHRLRRWIPVDEQDRRFFEVIRAPPGLSAFPVGPEVERTFTPSSCAIPIWLSVVSAQAGRGPNSSTWSSALAALVGRR
jgi:hypothetical protein